MRVDVLYFASLREARGLERETLDVAAGEATLASLYESLARAHAFALARERVRVAVNGAFVPWDHAIVAGDEIVFIPPVSGG